MLKAWLGHYRGQPLRQGVGRMLHTMATSAQDRASLGEDGRKAQRRFLCIVQDTALAQELFTLFRARDEETQIVATETEGLNLLLRNRWDAVLLEIRRPGRQGYAPCARVRKYWRGPLVLLLTSPAAGADVVRGYEMGADAYVMVPFDPRELVARVEALFQRSNHRAAAMA
jgi:DNA-binding response OmpR family regulator